MAWCLYFAFLGLNVLNLENIDIDNANVIIISSVLVFLYVRMIIMAGIVDGHFYGQLFVY